MDVCRLDDTRNKLDLSYRTLYKNELFCIKKIHTPIQTKLFFGTRTIYALHVPLGMKLCWINLEPTPQRNETESEVFTEWNFGIITYVCHQQNRQYVILSLVLIQKSFMCLFSSWNLIQSRISLLCSLRMNWERMNAIIIRMRFVTSTVFSAYAPLALLHALHA